MQHPVGSVYNPATRQDELDSFAKVLFNPAQLAGFPHVIAACLLTAGSLVAGIALWQVLPYAAAALAGAGAVAVVGVLSPAAGLVLAATLVVSALAAPAAAIALSRREERGLVPLRGELAAAPWSCLTARPSSPPSAPAAALSPPSRARGRGQARQASVPAMRGARGQR